MQVSDTIPRRATNGDEVDAYGPKAGRQRRPAAVKRRTRRRERRERREDLRTESIARD